MERAVRSPRVRLGRRLLAGVAAALLLPAAAQAARWTVSPSVGASLIWSDNVELAPPGAEESDLVGELAPGIVAEADGRRLDLRLAWQGRVRVSSEDSDRNEVIHRAEARAAAELAPRTFFLDAEASVDQALVSARARGGVDSIFDGNRTDVVRYALAPRLERDWGPVAGRLVLRHEAADFERGAADTRADTVTARLGSGRRPSPLTWSVDYLDSNLDREGGDDSESRVLEGNADWRVGRSLHLLARAGREDHELATSRSLENGTFWSAGFAWTPGRRFSLRALAGENDREVALRIAPTPRTSLDLAWRDRDVGLNPAGAWDATLTQRSRRSTLRLHYGEEVTSVQRLVLAGRQAFVLVDPATGAPVLDPVTGLPVVLFADVFSLADGEFLRERGDLSWDLRGARTTLRLGAFGERRTFELGGEVERARGLTVAVERRLGARTRGALRASRVRNEFDDGREDDTTTGELSIGRESARRLGVSAAYRHQRRDSTEAGEDYRENRVTVTVTRRF
ncbi:TIGR03016 family PEP-CTERM system-associated outer membrane protein [Inmirania thermothiophila]|uniref:Uncharacterized protein (PEP-CTERM system associated) n=1 Tax=Inmirania thermothiophila TaxID=1750597 RepID=A0A3N1Y8C0_9GAMM|nr:TIGR03016 family PEP-CTERM system-associated outer membrane protein [Inmirania thermothiophila]ROR34738.1 uncharacterized protein (PEP-CTERM system associated) [Inmirania thermothiophila]